MKIQISKIHPNPNNPRQIIRQDMVDNLALSIAAVGLLNPIKVAPDIGQGHELISGHIRLLACQKLGWTEIEANILDLTPEQRMDEAMLDNLGQHMFWLELYISIEAKMAVNQKLSQKQVAERLALDPSAVSRAIKALSLLSFTARKAILENFKNSGDFEVSEAAIYRITSIARDKNTLSKDKMCIESAINVVLDRKMTEQQAKKLVDWVKKGNAPETFPEDGKMSKVKGSKNQRFSPDDPNAKVWEHMPKTYQVRMTKSGYDARLRMDSAKAVLMLSAARAWEKAFEQRLAGSESSQPSEDMDALPRLLEEAIKLEASQEPATILVDGQNIVEADQPKPTTSDSMQTVKNLAIGILKNSAPEGIVGNILKAGIKKIFKDLK